MDGRLAGLMDGWMDKWFFNPFNSISAKSSRWQAKQSWAFFYMKISVESRQYKKLTL